MCWRIYFKVSPLPFIISDDAKVRRNIEKNEGFTYFNYNFNI